MLELAQDRRMLVNFQNESAILWGFNSGFSPPNDLQEDENDKMQTKNGPSYAW
jgi:hypothetical protein